MGEANRRGTTEEREAAAKERLATQVRELKVQHAALLALVRAQGRVRISRRELETIPAGSRIDAVRDEQGITLTFVEGER